MQVGLHTKLKAIFWDIPENRRLGIANKILSNPDEIRDPPRLQRGVICQSFITIKCAMKH